MEKVTQRHVKIVTGYPAMTRRRIRDACPLSCPVAFIL